MKFSALLVLLLTPLLACAWSADDHEIFRINDELQQLEGSNVTFYSFLGVARTASLDEINKAYRTKSRQLHPDRAIPKLRSKLDAQKAKANKKQGGKGKNYTSLTQKEQKQITREANERYARLPVITAILRDHRRDRYDYFLRNGFPRWRGTGYYYARFRPGIGSVLTGLALVFGGGMHYGAMYIGWKRHREFVERYISHAKRTAWGNENGIPGLSEALNGSPGMGDMSTPPPELEQPDNSQLNRKQKRMQEKESRKEATKKAAKTARTSGISKPVDGEPLGQNPQGARKKVVAENGKVLIVDVEGNVFLEETTEDGQTQELLLDVSFLESRR